jgi:hypothetical protein
MEYLKPLLKICSHFGLFFIISHLLISCQPMPRFQEIELAEYRYKLVEDSAGNRSLKPGMRDYAVINDSGIIQAYRGLGVDKNYYRAKISGELIDKLLNYTDTLKQITIYPHFPDFCLCKGRLMLIRIQKTGSSKTIFFYRDHKNGSFFDSICKSLDSSKYEKTRAKLIDSVALVRGSKELLNYAVSLDSIFHLIPIVEPPKIEIVHYKLK